MKYEIIDEIIHRRPLLSLDEFTKNMGKNKNICIDNIDDISLEAILIANYSLFNNVKRCKKEGVSNKSKKDILKSVRNYITRMSTRATPMGLFAVTSLGTSIEFNSDLSILADEIEKCISLDMVWVIKLLQKIEKEQAFLDESYVIWNHSTYSSGDVLKNIVYNNWGIKGERVYKQLKNTEAISFIKEITYNHTKYATVIEILSEKVNADKEAVKYFVNQLIENEYLLTNLRPTLNQNVYLYDLVKKLNNISEFEDLCNDLIYIKKLIYEYKSKEIGKGIELFEKIIKRMETIQKNDNYLKIDLVRKCRKTKVNKKIFSDVEEALDFQLSINMPSDYNLLKQYANKFQREYGFFTELPLLKLLDEDEGLGNPFNLEGDNKNSNTNLLNFLMDKLFNTSAGESIHLSSEDLNVLGKNNGYIPSGFEVYTHVQDVDSESSLIEVLPYTGTDKIGKTLGRFSYAFDNHKQNQVEAGDVRILEFFSDATLLNVSGKHSASDQKFLSIGTSNGSKNEIYLKDILVGLVRDSEGNSVFYFKDNQTMEILNFDFDSNINPYSQKVSVPSKFLVLASKFMMKNPFEFQRYIYSLDFIPHIPPIKYKNVSLTIEHWNINEYNIKGLSPVQVIKKFELPKYVMVMEKDNYLVMDMENQQQINELYQMILKKGSIKVGRFNPGNRKYIDEIVFGLRKINDYDVKEARIENIISGEKIIEKKYIVGDEWLYFKVYGVNHRTKEIICKYLNNFVKKLMKKKLINLFHYVVYDDGKKHVRIRLKIAQSNFIEEIICKIREWTHKLFNLGLITTLAYDTYTPEINRYGGKELMKVVEKQFHDDSLVAINYLKKNKDYISILCYALTIFKFFGYSYYGIKTCLNNRFNSKNRLKKEYRENLNELKKNCVKTLRNNTEQIIDPHRNNFRKLPNVRQQEVVFSVIHMFMNKVLIRREQEVELMECLNYVIDDLEYIVENDIEI